MTKKSIKNIALAFLELKDFKRIFDLDTYFTHRDFSKRDKELIRAEVNKILIGRQQSLLKEIKEGAASPVPLLSVLGWERNDERLDKTLPGLNR